MKKVLSLFLCLCLCLTLFSALGLTVSAAIDAIVYVNGQSLAVGSSLNVNGGTAKAEYNGGTDTLIITLDNCSIGSTVTINSTSYGFYVKTDITNVIVKLNGENVCESTFRIQGDSTYLDGTTNFLSGASGDGSLTVNGKFSVEHGDVYVDACELTLTGQNTNDAYAAYINNSLTLGTPAVKGGGAFSEPYIQLETERNIGMWINGPMTVNSGNSTFTGRYYGLFVKGSGYKPLFNVAGGYTACNGNQAGILLMFNRDYGVDPVNFTNGCGEFNFGKLACRENFDFGEGYKNAKFFSWMKPEWTDPLIVNGTPDSVYNGTLSCNAMTSMCFRQMGGVYVTFDCGEYGEVGGQQSWIQVQEYGEKIGLLPVPVNTTFRDGNFNNMYFSGWYIDEGDLFDVIDENYVLTHNITLHALWTEGQGTPFKDVKSGDWFKEAADYCYGQNLISGTGDGTKFSPNTVCTRAMVVSILYRLSGEPYVWGDNQFSDVKNNAWYAKAVIWAAENGIVSGVGGGKFSPDASITREQLASIMMRYASFRGLCDPDAGVMLIGFPDNDKVSSWAGDGMAWAVGTGLISGKPKNGQNYLDPKGTATRAEFASIMERFAKLTDGALTFFINDSFRVTVPDLWQGNVVCRTSSSEMGDWITFYYKQENELSGAGRICSLLITDGYDYFDLPHWEYFCAMLDDDNQIAYNVVFDLPTDVQCNEDPSSPLATAYFSMSIMKDALQVESDWYHMSHGVG